MTIKISRYRLDMGDKPIKNVSEIEVQAIPSADNTGNGDIIDDILAGASVAFPNLVYLNSAGEWALVDANAVATCQGLLGIALETKANGEACKVLLRGFVRKDAWTWTPGGIIYASAAAAGGLTQTAPSGTDDVVMIVGVATRAERMYFCPQVIPVEYTV